MSTYNIATAVNIDSLASKAGSDTYNLFNGGYLTVDQDSRYGTNGNTSAAMGNIVMAAGGACTVEFNATKVRLIPYNTGSGNVPASNTTISQGGASGLLIGVYADKVSAPVTSGNAMPATGYVKIKQWNSVAFAAGALSGLTANATGADVAGWIEIVGVDSTKVTVNRLNIFKVRGDWYALGTTTGSNADTFQIPNNGSAAVYAPGVWVEAGASSGVFEFYPSANPTSALIANLATDAVRGKVCWISAAGVVRFQNDATNSTGGYLPPTGCKVQIPNILFVCCTAATPTANVLPNATLATRYGFTTTGGGVIDIDKCLMNWYPAFAQPYSVNLSYMGVMTQLSVSEIAAPLTWSQVGVGQETPANPQFGLLMATCFAGGTMDKCTWTAATLAASGRYITSLTDISGFTITNERNAAFAARGNATTGCSVQTRVSSCTWTNTIVGLGRIFMTTNADVTYTNTVYYDCVTSTTPTANPMYAFDLATKCVNIKIDGITFGGLALVQPYSGILNVGATACSNIKLRNLGSYASPLDLGAAQVDGTWTRSTTTATATKNGHGLKTNDIIYCLISSDTAAITVATKTVTVTDANTFTFTCLNAGAASGTFTYYPTMSAYLVVLVASAAASNVEVKRCYTPHTRTGLYSADNSCKGFVCENVMGDFINAPIATAIPVLNSTFKGLFSTPAMTAQVAEYGGDWFDAFIMGTTPNTVSQAWSRTTTTATITSTAHNLRTGMNIVVTTTSDAAAIIKGLKSVTVLTKDTFTFVCLNGGAASGTISFTSLTGRIGLMMNEKTAALNNYTVTGTASFTSAGTLFFPAALDKVVWESPYYIIGHTAFPLADTVWAGGSKKNFNFLYCIDKNDGYGYVDSDPCQVNVVASAATYTRTTGSWLTDGFATGQSVLMSGFSNTGNNGRKIISSVNDTVMTMTITTGLVDETGSGDEQAAEYSNLSYPRWGGGGSNGSTNVTMTDTTGVNVGDYVFGTNIAPNAKVTSITNTTTVVVDIANIGSVSGILWFNQLPSETNINAQKGFKLRLSMEAIKGTASATWTRSTTTATCTYNNHGLTTNDSVYVSISSDVSAIVVGAKSVTVTGENTFTFTCLNAGAASGTLTFLYPVVTSVYIPTDSTETSRAYQYVLDPVTLTQRVKDSAGSAISGARVLLLADSGGSLPAQATVTISRSGSTATVAHTAHGMTNGQQVQIKGANQQEYNGIKTIQNVSANAYDYPVSGTPASPATGTIKATAVALTGLTNASGILSGTFAYSGATQPITGRARKATTAPYYQTNQIAGTIAPTGYDGTVFLVADA